MRCNWRSGRISLMPPEEYTKEILEGNLFNDLLLRNVIGTPSMLVRRNYLEQTGGFQENLKCLEDWELVLRLADVCLIGFVDEVLVEVHKTEGSISSNVGGYFLSRHYIISRYRERMRTLGILDRAENDMLATGKRCGLYEEIKEMLKRDALSVVGKMGDCCMDKQAICEQLDKYLKERNYQAVKETLSVHKDIVESNNKLSIVNCMMNVCEQEIEEGKQILFEKADSVEKIATRYTKLMFYLRRIDFGIADGGMKELDAYIRENQVSLQELFTVMYCGVVHKERVLQIIQDNIAKGEIRI